MYSKKRQIRNHTIQKMYVQQEEIYVQRKRNKSGDKNLRTRVVII